MTIEEFIEARLAEDEQVARAPATPGDRWEDRLSEEYPGEYRAYVARMGGDDFAHMHDRDDARHIARHDPARVLRQCTAVRSIMRTNSDVEFTDPGAALQIADALAAIWSDHPDYREEWAI